LVVTTALTQFSFLAHNLSGFVRLESHSPLLHTLQGFGITKEQLVVLEGQLTSQAERLTSSIVPLLSSIFAFVFDMLIVAIISIYLLIDGSKLRQQIQANTPNSQQHRLEFLLHTSQFIIGGYIRGQVFLSIIIGVLVGLGMALFHVPYALLLGVIAALLEFIPILGTIISGVICFLLALTQGWIVGVFVLIYFVVIHIIEGDILGPRIVGRAIGLHPLVSILALIAGSEFYGILGALFAAPVAGLIQAIIIAIWEEWRASHEEDFKKQRARFVTNLLSAKK
jgi:predicted PurR-regulated permease PerM